MNEGRLFVVSGPSGTGKGTICDMLIDEVGAILSVSMTTRKPRRGEVDGKSYYFVSKAEFEEIIAGDGFLEFAKVYGNYYGTPKKEVLSFLESGKDVILEIDVQGAIQIKGRYPDGVFIFVLPPSMATLRDRIIKRGSESDDAVRVRMGAAMNEISHIGAYNYYVVNQDINEAVTRVKAIVTAEHSKVTKGTYKLIEKFKEEL